MAAQLMTTARARQIFGFTLSCFIDKKLINFTYRFFALEYHPDKNLDDDRAHERMVKLNLARQVLLKDPEPLGTISDSYDTYDDGEDSDDDTWDGNIRVPGYTQPDLPDWYWRRYPQARGSPYASQTPNPPPHPQPQRPTPASSRPYTPHWSSRPHDQTLATHHYLDPSNFNPTTNPWWSLSDITLDTAPLDGKRRRRRRTKTTLGKYKFSRAAAAAAQPRKSIAETPPWLARELYLRDKHHKQRELEKRKTLAKKARRDPRNQPRYGEFLVGGEWVVVDKVTERVVRDWEEEEKEEVLGSGVGVVLWEGKGKREVVSVGRDYGLLRIEVGGEGEEEEEEEDVKACVERQAGCMCGFGERRKRGGGWRGVGVGRLRI
ncbi:MAG: hypothetical protein Q9160_004966 [Pyrenula sp. 1 TL-2023]